MNLCFLRGAVPTDRDPNEIKWNSLLDSTDLWEWIAFKLGDQVEIVYWGGKRQVEYAPGKRVVWVKSLKKYRPPWKPDVIFDRGGFKETHPFLKKCPAFKIYYGAGQRHVPIPGYSKYDLTLQDSPKRLEKAKKKFPKIKHILWTKPAIDIFHPKPYNERKYDVCYIANGSQADIKGIKWVYQTVPKDLKVLHLGNKSKYKAPKNVTTRRVTKDKMPRQINKCKVGILPYSKVDSAPRALPEMLACNLPVVCLDTVHINAEEYFIDPYLHTSSGSVVSKGEFWRCVKGWIESLERFKAYDGLYPDYVRRHYAANLRLDVCVEKLRKCLKTKPE